MAEHEYIIKRRVEFNETDMAGIVHYSNFFRYMEYAEHAFFRSLGRSIVNHELGIGWPRVHCACDFKHPLMFEDEVEIHMLISAKTSKTMGYQFRFRKDGTEMARGNVTVVCVRRTEAGVMKSTRIPSEISDIFEVAPADKLAD